MMGLAMCARLTGGDPFACVANSAANTDWAIDTATNMVEAVVTNTVMAAVGVGLNPP
jgi:hypothetical protein